MPEPESPYDIARELASILAARRMAAPTPTIPADPEYGTITLTRHADGTVTVDHADDIAGIDAAIIADAGSNALGFAHLWTDDAGNLVIAGQVSYRPVRFADCGRVIVCEKIHV